MNDNEQQVRKGDETLEKRGSVYGPYQHGLDIREALMRAILFGYQREHGKPMPEKYQSYFWDITNKLSRLSVTPNHEDSWNDIRGYSKLIRSTIMESEDFV